MPEQYYRIQRRSQSHGRVVYDVLGLKEGHWVRLICGLHSYACADRHIQALRGIDNWSDA